MKKIGILVFGTKEGGGIYQYSQSIIDALTKDNLNQYILFCDENDDRFNDYNLEIRRIKKTKTNYFMKIIRILQFLLLIRKSYFFTKEELEEYSDIDMFISPVISAYPHFYLNKPFIFTLHDMQERYYPEFFSLKQRLLRWLNNRTLAKSANKIICESNYVKNDIIKFTKVSQTKISVIQSPPPENFLNYQFKTEKFQKIKEKYNLPDKYIFYPAQCWFHKNHIKLVESFKKVIQKDKDIFLILTGSQQNNYNNLMKRIDELDLNTRVKHLGYIDYEDLPYLYKMSQMLVMPTLFESVSIPIYEAFALKVPVCSSNVVALPEQVGNAGLIFDPYDIDDMAKKILMYIKEEKLRKEKAQLGYEKVKNFDHDNYREKLLKVLNV